MTSRGMAQTADGTVARSSAAQPAIPTLQSLDQAVRSQDYTVVQVRRFRDGSSNVVSVRERLEVAANGSSNPGFILTFLGVEGEPVGSPTTLQWQQVYSRFASQFFTHGSFRVRDLKAATANYTMHDFGPVVRANRAARRMVVFPGTVDKALWVVDVDVQTSVPLYAAEFDIQLHLLAEVEVLTFSDTVVPFPAPVSGTTQVPDFATARAAMGNPAELVEPNVSATSDYKLDKVEVRNDPLNGLWKLTMSYTDGIDQFLVVEAPGTQDVFAGLPGKSKGGNVIGRFRDPAMSVLLFWEGGVSFHVAGRGSLRRLDELAHSVYLQALSSH